MIIFAMVQTNQELIELFNQEIHTLGARGEATPKITFDKNNFLCNPTVDYLSTCKLNRVSIHLLLNITDQLDFSCSKYLIDCWNYGLYDWKDTFMDPRAGVGARVQLIYFVCNYWCEEAILYILDIYEEQNLDLNCGDCETLYPIEILCIYGTQRTINRILDIYIARNLNLEDVSGGGLTLLQFLCTNERCDIPTMGRVTNIYIERNYDLERETKDKFNALHLVCKDGNMGTIKYLIDIFVERQLILKKEKYTSLNSLLDSNYDLDVNGKKCMWAYLNSMEVNVFV